MKASKRISLLAVVWLLIICMTVPAWADGASATATTPETAPTLYFDIDFEDMDVGAVKSNTWVGTGSTLWLGNNSNIAAEDDGNKVLRADKAAGSDKTVNPDFCLYPFKAMNAKSLDAYGQDFVVSWDLFVSTDDGAAFNFIAARSPSNDRKWAPSSFVEKAGTDGTASVTYTDTTGTKKTAEDKVAYGQWNRIAIIVHPAEGDSQIASYDIYVNGTLLAENVKAWFDTDRFTLGHLCSTGTTEVACYQMVDNIKCYSGNALYQAYETDSAQAPTPTLYFDIDFEDKEVGTSEKNGKWLDTVLNINVNQRIDVEEDGNKVLRGDKAAGAGNSNNPDQCLFPFKASSMNAASLAAYGKDFVISWDLFVSADDGADFNFISARSPDNSRKWAPVTYLKQAGSDGTANVLYTDTAGTRKTTEGTVAYGQWNRIAIIVHPAEGDSQIASYDIYVNGTLLTAGVRAWFDTDRFTLGKLCGNDTTAAACYQMIDNIRCYSGDVLWDAYEEQKVSKPAATPTETTSYKVGENNYISFTPTEDEEKIAIDSANAWKQADIDGAMGGTALYCETKAGNAAGDGFTWTLEVPAEGDYYVWGRFYYPNQTANSLFYSVDGGAEGIWDFPDEDDASSACYGSWHYFYMTERKSGTYSDTAKYGAWTIQNNQWRHSPVVLHLTAGTHTVKFTGREAGMYIDELIVTSYAVDVYNPNAYEGNTAFLETCKFCGTEWKHYCSDIYAETGVTAQKHFTAVLHKDAVVWENLGCEIGIHNPSKEITVITAATCTSEGVGKRVCSACGETLEENIVIEKTAHTASDWIVDVEAAVGVKGVQHKECTVCHAVLNEKNVPALKGAETEAATTGTPETPETPKATDATDNGEKAGCASAVGASGILGYLSVLGLGAALCRKKRF